MKSEDKKIEADKIEIGNKDIKNIEKRKGFGGRVR
jgi:hypothetical protein